MLNDQNQENQKNLKHRTHTRSSVFFLPDEAWFLPLLLAWPTQIAAATEGKDHITHRAWLWTLAIV